MTSLALAGKTAIVTGECISRATRSLDLLDQTIEQFAPPRRDDDLCAFGSEQHRDRASDAGTRAGDDRGFSVQRRS